jgi:type II secretory pathway component PulF
MSILIWVVDGGLWLLWVLVVAHVFPSFGNVFLEHHEQVNAYTGLFIGLGQALERPLGMGLVSFMGFILARAISKLSKGNVALWVMCGLGALWGATILALAMPMFLG